jgi:phospholipase/carboxylesterase
MTARRTTRALRARRSAPRSGKTRSAVVLLHGYGADGADLIGLAEPLGPHLPDTLFVAPDAPESCAASPFGRQWHPIPWIDGSSEETARRGAARAAADLDAFLDGLMAEEDLLPEQVALLGFSQGAMMALQVAPRRAAPVAAVVAISGMLVDPELLADELRARPPVLLIHGDRDDVVPIDALPAAARALEAAGWAEVYAHVMRGTGHGIAPDGLEVALAFLRERLGRERRHAAVTQDN